MKIGAVLTSTLETALVLWQLVALSLQKANGRLHPHLFGTLDYCNGTALCVLSGGVVDRVFRDVIESCAAPQNPGGPYLVMEALISLSDAKSFVWNGECSVLPYSPTFIKSLGA